MLLQVLLWLLDSRLNNCVKTIASTQSSRGTSMDLMSSGTSRSRRPRIMVVWGRAPPHVVGAVVVCVGISVAELLAYVASHTGVHLLHIRFHEMEASLVLRRSGTCRCGVVHLYPCMVQQVLFICLCLAARHPEHAVACT